MNPGFSIITPAYLATDTIANTVQSVLAQDFTDWELLIVSDDGEDYAQVLGLDDPRIRYLSTGKVGSGSSNARNVALEAADRIWVAVLDADDRFLPQKLSRFADALGKEPLVSCALEVTASDGTLLRTVGAGPNRMLTGGTYKRVNISMDSMIAYDRGLCDARFDADQPCLTDIDFVLKLFAQTGRCFHLGTPLHQYVKQPVSISNGPGVAERMIATKRLILSRLETGYYGLPPEAAGGFVRFYETSLLAEESYEAALDAESGLLFEDHLEKFLDSRDAAI